MAELSHSNVEPLKFHWQLFLTYNRSAESKGKFSLKGIYSEEDN